MINYLFKHLVRKMSLNNRMIQACEAGDLNTVKHLIEVCGCKSYMSRGYLTYAEDKHGCSCLWYASECGHLHVVKYLIEKLTENDINVHIESGTALMFASSNGYFDIVIDLVNRGADINFENRDGRTALMYACTKGAG